MNISPQAEKEGIKTLVRQSGMTVGVMIVNQPNTPVGPFTFHQHIMSGSPEGPDQVRGYGLVIGIGDRVVFGVKIRDTHGCEEPDPGAIEPCEVNGRHKRVGAS